MPPHELAFVSKVRNMSSIEHLMTVADLENFPEDDGNRYELIEGELHVSTAPGIPHQVVLRNLLLHLHPYLETHQFGKIVPGPGAILSNFDAVIPDIVIVRNERWDQIIANNRFNAAPDLVIEILSTGSENRRRDVIAKRRLYGTFGVEEYWIVDGESRSVVIFTLQGNVLEEVATFSEAEMIVSSLLPELNLKVSAVFAV
jgi:Uma2 family endonuclease